jgi:hypothetical protein
MQQVGNALYFIHYNVGVGSPALDQLPESLRPGGQLAVGFGSEEVYE